MRTKRQRQLWWQSLSAEQKSAYIRKKEENRNHYRKEPFKFSDTCVLDLDDALRAEITETMHRIGMSKYIPW